jgi:hypothetical protein
VFTTNSVGPGMGPSSNVRYNSFCCVAIRQVSFGNNHGNMNGVRNNFRMMIYDFLLLYTTG